jgi:hypothetical protein
MPVYTSHSSISRHEFLKLAQMSAASLLLMSLNDFIDYKPDTSGRVTAAKIISYQEPSIKSKTLQTYYRDMVIPIYEVTVGDSEPSYNRGWYQIGKGEFVHSGSLQPVKTQLNPVVSEVL